MHNRNALIDWSRTKKLSSFRLGVLIFGLLVALAPLVVQAASIHATSSAPWRAFADPLSDATGSPLLPAVFDALTMIERDGTLTPALAESWHNDSGTVWTFKLRPNVLFSDGTPLNADVVVDCLSMLIGPTGQAYAPYQYTSEISSVRALSEDEVEITTRQNDARLDRKLSNVSIFNVSALHRLGRTEFSKNPVGTGPFTPESWSNDGTRVVLKYVPTSWRKSRQVERVEIALVPDSSARLQSILSEGTDISSNLDPDLIPTIEGAGLSVSVRPGPLILAFALRTAEGAAAPLKDRRVRLALNMAIDRKSISQHLLHGTMEPATQLATPTLLGYDLSLETYTYDPDQARKLLTEAGYPNGFNLAGTVMTGQFPADALIFQQVVQNLDAIGVRVVLGTLPVIEFLRRRRANTWEGTDLLSTLQGHYRFGDISRAAELLSCHEPMSTFCDPTTDDLLNRSHQEMNPSTREHLLKAVNARLSYLAPLLLISQYSAIDALSKRIARFPPFPMGKMRFEQFEIVERR